MTLETTTQHLNNVVLIDIAVRLVSGRKRIKADEIEDAKGVEIQVDDVMTLGSKKVFDPEKLQVFDRLREQMHRECRRVGTAFLSGYAIPESKVDALTVVLDGICQKAEVERAALVQHYDDYLTKYCDERPEWAAVIRQSAYSVDYIRERISFSFSGIKVVPGRDNGVLSRNLQNQVGGMLGSLLRDVADEAEQLQERSLKGKDKKTRKVLSPLIACREKLLGFSFLDPRLEGVANVIKTVESKMPSHGPIEGDSLAWLWAITSVLCDPEKTLAMAQSFMDDADRAMSKLMPASVAAGNKAMPAPVDLVSPIAQETASSTPGDASLGFNLFGGIPGFQDVLPMAAPVVNALPSVVPTGFADLEAA